MRTTRRGAAAVALGVLAGVTLSAPASAGQNAIPDEYVGTSCKTVTMVGAPTHYVVFCDAQYITGSGQRKHRVTATTESQWPLAWNYYASTRNKYTSASKITSRSYTLTLTDVKSSPVTVSVKADLGEWVAATATINPR